MHCWSGGYGQEVSSAKPLAIWVIGLGKLIITYMDITVMFSAHKIFTSTPQHYTHSKLVQHIPHHTSILWLLCLNIQHAMVASTHTLCVCVANTDSLLIAITTKLIIILVYDSF